MFLESSYSVLGKICAVAIGSCQLVFHAFCFDGCNKIISCFIAKALANGFDSRAGQLLAACLMPLNQIFRLSALDWVGKGSIGITAAHEEEVIIAVARFNGKSPWQVRADQALQIIFSYNSEHYLVALL